MRQRKGNDVLVRQKCSRIGDRRSKMSLRFCTLYVATHWGQALFEVAIEFSYTINFTGLNFSFKYRISSYSFFLNLEIVANSNSCRNISFFYLLTKLNFCWGNYSRAKTIWGNTVLYLQYTLFEIESITDINYLDLLAPDSGWI